MLNLQSEHKKSWAEGDVTQSSPATCRASQLVEGLRQKWFWMQQVGIDRFKKTSPD